MEYIKPFSSTLWNKVLNHLVLNNRWPLKKPEQSIKWWFFDLFQRFYDVGGLESLWIIAINPCFNKDSSAPPSGLFRYLIEYLITDNLKSTSDWLIFFMHIQTYRELISLWCVYIRRSRDYSPKFWQSPQGVTSGGIALSSYTTSLFIQRQAVSQRSKSGVPDSIPTMIHSWTMLCERMVEAC